MKNLEEDGLGKLVRKRSLGSVKVGGLLNVYFPYSCRVWK